MTDIGAPLVVVGAGAAGLTVVDALRRQGYHDPIVMIGAEIHPPYDRPPLSKGFLLGALDRSRIALREPAALDRLDVDLRLGRNARGIDVEQQVVHLDDGSDLPYSQLVVATGVRSAQPEGLTGGQVVHVLRTLDDAERLAAALHSATDVAVIGGGLLGYELAAAARSTGREVTLIDRSQVPLGRALGPLAGQVVGELHRAHGVELRSAQSVRTLRQVHAGAGAGPAELTLDDKTVLRADVVIAAVGSVPNVEWLHGSGLDLRDGVGCDRFGRAAPGVYAIGDVARWGAVEGVGVRVEHRTNATDQALAVAQHIIQGTAGPVAVPYFWTDQFGERIQVAGRLPTEAHTEVVAGDLAERRFVLRSGRDQAPHGVLAWRMAKDFARHRAQLATTG